MLAANITTRLGKQDDALPATPFDEMPDPDEVLRLARGPWRLTPAAVKRCADRLVVSAAETVLGVYTITAAHRDDAEPDLVTFDLRPSPAWQWAIGEPNPFPFKLSNITIKQISPLFADSFWESNPERRKHKPRAGWDLEVADDGRSAVVIGPGSLAVIELQGAAAQLTVTTPESQSGTGSSAES